MELVYTAWDMRPFAEDVWAELTTDHRRRRGDAHLDGEGSIRKRKDGRYEASVLHLGKRRSVYGKTQKEVREKLGELQKQLAWGQDLSNTSLTVGEFMLQYYNMVAIVMGLRQGEILGLLKTDVDLEKRRVRINHQIQLIGGVLTRVPTKTEASHRVLVIPDILVPHFERALQHQRDNSLLFPSATGTPINPRNLVRQFKLLLTKAGLPDTIRFHDLRHTAGSMALAHGMDVKTAQRMLGHAQARTTLDTYGHALEELQDIAVNDAVNTGFGVDNTEDKPHQ